MGDNADQISYWNEVAGAKWVANQDRLDRLMTPLTEALVAAAAPRRGELVVDVGCGCGDLALRLAEAVGSAGLVRALDISRPMLAHAEARRAALGEGDRATIQWIPADASAYQLPPVTDLMVSRFGVMFFDDRPAAFANLHGALGEGGRFAFLTWRHRAEVEWLCAPLGWIASVLPPQDEEEDEVGPFALADEAATIAMLTTAGFKEVAATPVDEALVIGEGGSDAVAVDDALKLLSETGMAARLMLDACEDAKAKARELMREGLAERSRDGRVSLGGACWLYTGRA